MRQHAWDQSYSFLLALLATGFDFRREAPLFFM